MTESDATYFGRRAGEERAAANRAACAEARRAHLEMAERYDDMARAIVQCQPRIALQLVN